MPCLSEIGGHGAIETEPGELASPETTTKHVFIEEDWDDWPHSDLHHENIHDYEAELGKKEPEPEHDTIVTAKPKKNENVEIKEQVPEELSAQIPTDEESSYEEDTEGDDEEDYDTDEDDEEDYDTEEDDEGDDEEDYDEWLKSNS